MAISTINLGRVLGSQWFTGTALVHTSGTETTSTGITYAMVGDMYLNTETAGVYRCTTAGASGTAAWKYVANIKGAAGQNGSDGADGTSFLCESGTPTSDIGADGDTYLDAAGPTLYRKAAGAWAVLASAFDEETIDLADDAHFSALRHEVEQDTREFLTYCNNPPSEYDGRVVAIRRAGVVTLYFNRTPFAVESEENYTYSYGYVEVGGEQKDHKTFGVILPEGWRPEYEVRVPCEVYGGTSPNYTRYTGTATIHPNGAISIVRLFQVSNGAVVTTATLSGLLFSATYVLP